MSDERPKFGRDGYPADKPMFPPLAYSFLRQAAAEARADSRRYWQQNDKRFPVLPVYWGKKPNGGGTT